MNTPQDWNITLAYFDGPNVMWGRTIVNKPEIPSTINTTKSIYFDNLPLYIRKGLLKDDGTVDTAKLENHFLNKAQEVINGIVGVRVILNKGDVFALLPDTMKTQLRDVVVQYIQNALMNSFIEKTTGNNITTSGLTISDNLTSWITRGNALGTNAFTTLMNSKVHLVEYDPITKTISYDGEAIVVDFKTKELVKDVEIDTTNEDALLTRKEITSVVGSAIQGSKVEILSSTNIDDLKTNYDTYIKNSATKPHTEGDVVDLQYTGTDALYLNPEVVESYVFDGSNYIIITDNVKDRDERKRIEDELQTELSTKANDADVIKKDNSIDLTGKGVIDYTTTPAEPNKIGTRQEVANAILQSSQDLKGNNATQTITGLEAKDASLQAQINALQGNLPTQIVKGKWQIKDADTSPSNSPTQFDNTATWTLPTTDDNGNSITRQNGDLAFIKIDGETAFAEQFSKVFALQVEDVTSSTKPTLLEILTVGYSTPSNLEVQLNDESMDTTTGDLVFTSPLTGFGFIPGDLVDIELTRTVGARTYNKHLYAKYGNSDFESQPFIDGNSQINIAIKVNDNKIFFRNPNGGQLSAADKTTISGYLAKIIKQSQGGGSFVETTKLFATLDRATNVLTLTRDFGTEINFSTLKLQSVTEELFTPSADLVSTTELNTQLNNKVDKLVNGLNQNKVITSSDVINGIKELDNQAVKLLALGVSDAANQARIFSVPARDDSSLGIINTIDEDNNDQSGTSLDLKTYEGNRATIKVTKGGEAYIESYLKQSNGAYHTNKIELENILKLDDIDNGAGTIIGKGEDIESADGNQSITVAATNEGTKIDFLDDTNNIGIRQFYNVPTKEFTIEKVNSSTGDIDGIFKPFSDRVGLGIGSGFGQARNTVGIGTNSANSGQKEGGVGIGFDSAYQNQGFNATAAGAGSGQYDQKDFSSAYGALSGNTNLGQYSLVMGYKGGYSNTPDKTIVLNASGLEENGTADTVTMRTDNNKFELKSDGLYINGVKQGGAPLPNTFTGNFSKSPETPDLEYIREQLFLNITTSVGEQAFSYLAGLTSINIPNATTIGKQAFLLSAGLTSINIPNATTIGDGAFSIGIPHSPGTTVTMKSQFNTTAEKDRIFGANNWQNITFTFV